MRQHGKTQDNVSRGPIGDAPASAARSGFRDLRSKYETPYRSVAALFRVATAMNAGARGVRVSAMRLDAWLEKRRIAAAALYDFGTMGERELLDIGLTRVDLHRVAWGASDRIQDGI